MEDVYDDLEEEELNTFGRTNDDEDGYVSFYYPEEINDATKDYYPNTFFDCYFEWKADWETEKKMVSGATPGTGDANDWQSAA